MENINFHFFSANLHFYLPHIPWSNHRGLYDEWCRIHLQTADYVVEDVNLGYLDKAEPGIIATFHLGDHSYLPHILAKEGIEFDILIAQTVRDRYQNYFDQLAAQLHHSLRPQFILADKKDCIFKIKETIQSGRHILVYADGFVGVKMHEGNTAHLVEIDFFDHPMRVRQGIGFLSYCYRLPVYPLLNMGDNRHIKLTCMESILPSRMDDRKGYSKNVLQHIYNHLQDRLTSCPMQWECWSYLHKEGAIPLGIIRNNVPHMKELNILGKKLWMDVANYRFYGT